MSRTFFRKLKYMKVTKNIDASFDEKVDFLKNHLAQYTPAWAEKISGVKAAKIKKLHWNLPRPNLPA